MRTSASHSSVGSSTVKMVIRKLYVPPAIVKVGIVAEAPAEVHTDVAAPAPEAVNTEAVSTEAVAFSIKPEAVAEVPVEVHTEDEEPVPEAKSTEAVAFSTEPEADAEVTADVHTEDEEPVAEAVSAEPAAFSTETEVVQPAENEATHVDDVIVEIAPGKIEGVKEVLPNGENFYRFSGIPYAKPPVGDLRFKPPVALEQFDVELLECKREGSNCPSPLYYPPEREESASEDCLFMNVYTPHLPREETEDAALPVMVFIHGGGFNMGSGDAALYGPDYLVQEGVVLVTFNYRLGPLGFLYFPAKGIYGNMGLKDQRLALQWVQKNIACFGGDPKNVTIFGESAGGASVHLNYLADSSREYFHKAICMSGVSYNPWVLQANPEEKTRRLAELAGSNTVDVDEVYDTLMKASAKDLVLHSSVLLTDDEKRVNKFFAFTPVVEPSNAEEPFLTEDYISLMMKPNMTKIPVINGFTSSEGQLIAAQMLNDIQSYSADLTKLVPAEFPLSGDRLIEAAQEIKRFYFGEDHITAERLSTLVDVISDNMFVMAAYVASELHARYQNDAPFYFYLDSFEGKLNKYRNFFHVPEQLTGVCHADDLLYLFSSSWMGTDVESGSREDKFRSTWCKLWTNFARCGNPTPADGGVDFVWKQVKPVTDSQFTLAAAELNDVLKMVENPFMERIQFWRELYAKYYGSYLTREN